ncbi:outer membrane protein transport protein [soil metagenome]
MKKILSIAILLIAYNSCFAQEPADALKFSWTTQGGTARNQAIGGAGVSLGGEFSSLFINPAGLGFYRTGEWVFTPGLALQKNKNNYKDLLTKSAKNYFNLGASGAVFTGRPRYSTIIENYAIGIGINKSADFSSDISYSGLNKLSSYSEQYLEELFYNNVTNISDAANNYTYGSSLAYRSKLIDTIRDVDGSIAGYTSRAPILSGVNQQNNVISKGGVYDIALGGAVNLLDKWFLGASIDGHLIYYNRKTNFRESDASTNTGNNFNFFQVDQSLITKGAGIGVKLGAIYKPVEYVRIGLTIHSPSVYVLTDNYSTDLTTDLEGYKGTTIQKNSSKDFNAGKEGVTKYNLITPWRAALGASYVFREVENVQKQRAFITGEVEYVNHRNSSFKADRVDNTQAFEYYNSVNNVIRQQYRGTFNFRLGGELKFNTVMFRLGGAYYMNPYRYDKGYKAKLSGGLGYRNKGFFADLTYSYAITKDVNYPYRLQDVANEAAFIKSNSGNIFATIGFKF